MEILSQSAKNATPRRRVGFSPLVSGLWTLAMGNVCCGAGDYEMRQRQELLKEGNDFKKKTPYLGGVLSKTEPIYLQLNATASRLQWRVTPVGSNKSEELAIGRMGKVCPSGSTDLIILGAGGQKLLELTAATTAIRDLWVQTLDELAAQQTVAANDEEAKALQQELTKQTEKHKDRYWKDRTNDMEQRRLDAEERKKKFGVVGMRYTAQALASR